MLANGMKLESTKESMLVERSEKQDGLHIPNQTEEDKIVPLHRQTRSLDETSSTNNLSVPFKASFNISNRYFKYIYYFIKRIIGGSNKYVFFYWFGLVSGA